MPSTAKLLARSVDWQRVALGVVLLVALFLHLTPHWSGFWLDELYTVHFANPEVPFSKRLIWRILDDPQPFPYYLSMWGWHSLVGVSEPSSRFVGGAVLAACLLATAFILRPVLPARAASLTVAVLAFSWAGVQFSHEARSYALLYGFSCVGYALLIRSLVAGPTAHQTRGLMLAAVAAGAVHYYGMVLGCALFAGRAVGLWRLGQHQQAKRDVYRMFALAAFYVALLLPQLRNLADRAGGEFWISNDPAQLIAGYLSLFTFGIAGKTGLGLLAAGAFLGERRYALIVPVAAAVAASFVVPALLSLHTPMLLPRYLIITIPPLLLLLALTCGFGRTGLSAGLGLAAAILLFVDAGLGYFNFQKDGWSSSAALVSTAADGRCPIPVWAWQPVAYGYYLGPQQRSLVLRVPPAGPLPTVPDACRIVLWAAAADGLRLAPPKDVMVVKLGSAQVWLRRGTQHLK